MIFVNSMSDLFHEGVSDEYIAAVVDVMMKANWHTYQVLTKRSSRMQALLQTKLLDAAKLPHIWWGVSVENRKHGLPRIEHLRQAPAQIRILSIEPLLEDLGRIDLTASIGSSSAVRAVRRQDRSIPNGFAVFEINAWFLMSRSSSSNGEVFSRVGSGRVLDGRTYDEFPQTPRYVVPDLKERTRRLRQFESESMKTL